MSKLHSDYKWELIIYPDSYAYDYTEIITAAQSFFDTWAYILHDKDQLEDGEECKPHYHFIGKREKPCTPEAVAYMISIPIGGIANIKSWRAATRYLVHMDQPEKHQYAAEDIVSNIDLKQYLKNEIDDDLQAEIIYNYIKQNYGKVSMPVLTEWVLQHHLWSAFRRGFAVWSKLLRSVENEDYRKASH